jgi:hypothetical protein
MLQRRDIDLLPSRCLIAWCVALRAVPKTPRKLEWEKVVAFSKVLFALQFWDGESALQMHQNTRSCGLELEVLELAGV